MQFLNFLVVDSRRKRIGSRREKRRRRVQGRGRRCLLKFANCGL